MYSYLYRALFGPKWLKITQLVVLALGAASSLFLWVFPWAVEFFKLSDNVVS